MKQSKLSKVDRKTLGCIIFILYSLNCARIPVAAFSCLSWNSYWDFSPQDSKHQCIRTYNTVNELQWKSTFIGRFNHITCWVSNRKDKGLWKVSLPLNLFPVIEDVYFSFLWFIFLLNNKVKHQGLGFRRTFRLSFNNYQLKHKPTSHAVDSKSCCSSRESPGIE